MDDGSLKCWGQNRFGQLGQGDRADRGDDFNEMGDNLLPVDLGAGRTAVAVAAGGGFTCALLDDGSVKCWGLNNDGALGQGDTIWRGDDPNEMGDNLPAIDLGTDRIAVGLAAGQYHICARLEDGSVKCWGRNYAGVLGQGDRKTRGDDPNEMGNKLAPIELGTGRTALGIAAGLAHTCALLDDESLKCWGENHRGRLGLGDPGNRGDHRNEMGDNLPTVRLVSGATQPECRIFAIAAGPPTRIEIYVRDAKPGVHSIALLKNSNAAVEIVKGSGSFYNAGDVVTFDPPNTDVIMISASKIDETHGRPLRSGSRTRTESENL